MKKSLTLLILILIPCVFSGSARSEQMPELNFSLITGMDYSPSLRDHLGNTSSNMGFSGFFCVNYHDNWFVGAFLGEEIGISGSTYSPSSNTSYFSISPISYGVHGGYRFDNGLYFRAGGGFTNAESRKIIYNVGYDLHLEDGYLYLAGAGYLYQFSEILSFGLDLTGKRHFFNSYIVETVSGENSLSEAWTKTTYSISVHVKMRLPLI